MSIALYGYKLFVDGCSDTATIALGIASLAMGNIYYAQL